MNIVIVQGRLSSDPRPQQLPSGDTLIAYEVTTDVAGERLSVPVVWFNPNRIPAIAEGDEVVAVGRVRRRFFRAGAAAASRTEVVAEVVARSDRRAAARAIEAAAAEAAGATSGGG